MTPEFPSTQIPTYDVALVDGSYLIHRILYASGSKGEPPFSEMYNSAGDPTGAIYGCLKTTRYILNHDDFKLKDVIVIWDGRPRGLSPRRVAMYPKYKLHEDHGDPTAAAESAKHRNLLETQRPFLCNLLNNLGVPSVNIPLREGDDIIACTARLISPSVRVLVLSDDRDYFQLVTNNVHVYRAGLKVPVLVNEENFESKVGVKSASHYLLTAAISGDGSDNIEGITGVGGTTAERLANNTIINGGFVSYNELKKSAESLMVSDTRNRSRYAKVIENIDIVTRNLGLMDLRLESINVDERALLLQEIQRSRGVQDREVLREFNRLEFKSYLDSYSEWVQPFRRIEKYDFSI